MSLSFVILRLALESLTAHRLRNLLTVAGVAMGILALVLTSGLGAGFESRVDHELAALGTHLLRVEPRIPSTDRRGERSLPRTLTARDAARMAAEIPGIRDAIPLDFSTHPVKRGAAAAAMTVLGAGPGLAETLRLEVEAGHLFAAEEGEHNAKVAVLGARTARFLSGSEPAGNLVGSSILVDGVPLKVVGILALRGPVAGLEIDSLVFVPLGTLRLRIAGTDRSNADHVETILVDVADPSHKGEIRDDIASLLREAHRIGPGDDGDAAVTDLAGAAQAQDTIANLLRVFLLVIAALCLSLGGLGTMNMMLVSVSERTQEIGVRLAIGATRAEIVCQFLIEAALLTAAGGALGLILAWPAGWQVERFAGQPVLLGGDAAACALLVSVGVGLLSGLVPALRASALSPMEALRRG